MIVCTIIWFKVFLSNPNNLHKFIHSPVDWGFRIHRLHLCRMVRPYPTIVPTSGLVMTLNILMASHRECKIPLHCHQVHYGLVEAALDKVLLMGQTDLFNHLNCENK